MDRLPDVFKHIEKRYSGRGFGEELVRGFIKTKQVRKHGSYSRENKNLCRKRKRVIVYHMGQL